MAAHIDKITEDKIKQAANIVSVIEDWVKLRKTGVEYVGLCPFHDDHTPTNFKVNPNKQIYKCFSCGAGGDVFTFLKDKAGLDYGDALRYLAHKFSVYVPDEDPKDRDRWAHIKPGKPRSMEDVEPEKQMLILPREWVKWTMQLREPNNFIEWISGLPWNQEQRARVQTVLWQYCVGRWRDGRVVFWFIDEQGRPHGGKLMRYGDNGKRVKTEDPSWIHYQRDKHGNKLCDMKTYKYSPTLFGLHLINRYQTATINVVESEKTALICAIAYGQTEHNLWLACGGLEQFKIDTLRPLIEANRRVWMWPDKDGVEKWHKKLADMPSEQVTITTKFLTDYWHEEDGEKADVADVILRHIQHPETAKCNEPDQTHEVIEIWDSDEPFLDPEELDPQVRKWREILSERYNFNKSKNGTIHTTA